MAVLGVKAEIQSALPSDELAQERYARNVNPQWVRLLKLLQMNVEYERCLGAELFTKDGETILDFLSGYCVHNVGHNHPAVIAALKDELDRRGPAMLQSHVPELAGKLAAQLCQRAGGRLTKAFFCSSGSEGIETVIKFTRCLAGKKHWGGACSRGCTSGSSSRRTTWACPRSGRGRACPSWSNRS